MNYIKKFESYTKYPNVHITYDDKENDFLKLDIINEYFPFQNISGIIDREKGIVDLTFDDGKFYIYGEYDEKTETMPSEFITEDSIILFNYHKFGAMGGDDIIDFKKELELIKNELNTWRIVLTHEGNIIFNAKSFESKYLALKEFDDYKLEVVRGNKKRLD